MALIFKRKLFLPSFLFLTFFLNFNHPFLDSFLPSLFLPSLLSSLPSFSLPSFGQRPQRGRSLLEHRGTFVGQSVHPSFCSFVLSGLKSTLSDSGPLPCFLSFQFTFMQSRATGIVDHLLPLATCSYFLPSLKGKQGSDPKEVDNLCFHTQGKIIGVN